MSKYADHASEFATTTGVKTAILLAPASNRRAEVVELIMTGAGATAPADVQHLASAAFCTNAGAGTGSSSQTPEKVSGQGAPAAGTVVTVTYATEPTAYSTVFPVFFGFNQRGGQRWAVPQGEGLKVDSGATAMKLGWRVQSSAVGAVDGNAHFWED